MQNNYVDQLEEWIKANGMRKPDTNVAAFLAVREMVKARLEDGYSATTIHAFLRDSQQIDFCYDTFLNYVHHYVQPARKKAKSRTANLGTGRQAHTVASATTKQSAIDAPMPGFKFNPTPNIKDLI